MLELAKAATFFACLLSLYWTAISAFFIPGLHWQDRLFLALARLVLAAAICFLSGLIFRLPTRSNPDAHLPSPPPSPCNSFSGPPPSSRSSSSPPGT